MTMSQKRLSELSLLSIKNETMLEKLEYKK
jgi:hypothetical protein